MLNKYLNDLRLSKLAYLLETIELSDINSKIKAFNKISKMKLSKEEGLLILNNTNFDAHKNSDFNITISLLSLLFRDYYPEYSNKVKSIYKKLTEESKLELLNIISNTNNKDAVILYKDLVLKYGNELDDIPIGRLSLNKSNYDILFPDLYKVLKYKKNRNNIILLIYDFINSGVVKESHFRKYKKTIQDSVNGILKEGINYKFKKDELIMQNKDYINLRVYLEAAVVIEYYVTGKTSSDYLNKLFNKKDNQLKLFILENFIKKGYDLKKYNLNPIAKDILSRYPLFSFLEYYNLEDLMPKKYSSNRQLSESDLFINFCVYYKYSMIPQNMELLEERIIDKARYFIYKFETPFNYYEEVKDAATDYILKTTYLDKKLIENSKSEYIGISGGYDPSLEPCTINNVINYVPFRKLGTNNQSKVIDSICPKIDIIKVTKEKGAIIKNKFKLKKIKFKKINIRKIDFSKFKKKNKIVKVKKEKPVIVDEPIIEKEETVLNKIFSFNTLFLILVISLVLSSFVLFSYVNGNDILNLRKGKAIDKNISFIKKEKIIDKNKDKYNKINYRDIFKMPESEYYVLIINNKKESYFNYYLNILLENDYKIYLVDLRKEDNKNLYEGNESGFIISDETLIKVKDGEYEFFVINNNNILKEMKDYVDKINKEKEELKEKEKLSKEKKIKKEEKVENNN